MAQLDLLEDPSLNASSPRTKNYGSTRISLKTQVLAPHHELECVSSKLQVLTPHHKDLKELKELKKLDLLEDPSLNASS